MPSSPAIDDPRFATSDHLIAKARNVARKERLAGHAAVIAARNGEAVTDNALRYLVRELSILWKMQDRNLRLVKVTGTSRWDNYALMVGNVDQVGTYVTAYENIGNRRVTLKVLDASVLSARFTAEAPFRP